MVDPEDRRIEDLAKLNKALLEASHGVPDTVSRLSETLQHLQALSQSDAAVICEQLQMTEIAWDLSSRILTSDQDTNARLHVLQVLLILSECQNLRLLVIAFIPHIVWLWLSAEMPDEHLDALESLLLKLESHYKTMSESIPPFLMYNDLKISSIYRHTSIPESRQRLPPTPPKTPNTGNMLSQPTTDKGSLLCNLLKCYEDHLVNVGVESLLTFCVFCDWLLSSGNGGPIPLTCPPLYPYLPTSLNLPQHLSRTYRKLAGDTPEEPTSSVGSAASANSPDNPLHEVKSISSFSALSDIAPSHTNNNKSNTITSNFHNTNSHSQDYLAIPPVTKSNRPVLTRNILRSILSSLYYCWYYYPSKAQVRAMSLIGTDVKDMKGTVVHHFNDLSVKDRRSIIAAAGGEDAPFKPAAHLTIQEDTLSGGSHHSSLTQVQDQQHATSPAQQQQQQQSPQDGHPSPSKTEPQQGHTLANLVAEMASHTLGTTTSTSGSGIIQSYNQSNKETSATPVSIGTTGNADKQQHALMTPVSQAFKEAMKDIAGVISKLKNKDAKASGEDGKNNNRGASRMNPRTPSLIQKMALRSLHRLHDRSEYMQEHETAVACGLLFD